MRLPHHLLRTPSGVFYFQMRVPKSFQRALGTTVLRRSLGTRDGNVARVWSYALSLRYAQAFAGNRDDAMQKPPPPIADLVRALESGETRPYEVHIDPLTRAVTSLRTDGTQADATAAQKALETMLRHSAMLAGSAPPSRPKPIGKTLQGALLTYAMTEGPGLRPNTWEARQRATTSFIEALGANTLVTDVTRPLASAWAHELIAKGMNKKTAGNYVSQVAQIFRKLIEWGDLEGSNPVKGVIVVSKKEKATRRAEGFQWEPLELFDLKRIFDPANLARTRTAHVRWGALIGLYTGARVGEVAQLFLRDFSIEDGIKCVRFWTENDGQTQKTEASRRLVPLHPDLLKLGIWERMEDLKCAGEERFFPNMRIDSKAGNGNAISKGFGYYIGDQLGAKPRRKNGTIGFHSLRKNVIQALQGSHLSAERRRAFVGHENGDADVHEQAYMRPWTADELASLFPGLTWGEWLDFEGLRAVLANAKH